VVQKNGSKKEIVKEEENKERATIPSYHHGEDALDNNKSETKDVRPVKGRWAYKSNPEVRGGGLMRGRGDINRGGAGGHTSSVGIEPPGKLGTTELVNGNTSGDIKASNNSFHHIGNSLIGGGLMPNTAAYRAHYYDNNAYPVNPSSGSIDPSSGRPATSPSPALSTFSSSFTPSLNQSVSSSSPPVDKSTVSPLISFTSSSSSTLTSNTTSSFYSSPYSISNPVKPSTISPSVKPK
jgi:hypothetical protein